MRFQVFHVRVNGRWTRDFTPHAYEIPVIKGAWRHDNHSGKNIEVLALRDYREADNHIAEFNRLVGIYGPFATQVYPTPEKLLEAMEQAAKETAEFEAADHEHAMKIIAENEAKAKAATKAKPADESEEDDDTPAKRGPGRPRKGE